MKFKVGDKVKCIKGNKGDVNPLIGETFTIEGITTKFGILAVHLRELPNYTFYADYFELVKDEKIEFKVGDKVSVFGVEGKVVNIFEDVPYPIRVLVIPEGITQHFTTDGKYSSWHKEPSLKFISRPKKKVTKTIEAWANVYPTGDTPLHLSEESADSQAKDDRITCVKLTGTYEIEE